VTPSASPGRDGDPAAPELHFAVHGMTCASCASRVQRTLSRQPGVDQAHVNFATGQATVTLAGDDGARAEQLSRAIDAIGYGLRPVTDDEPPAGDESAAEQRSWRWRALAAVPLAVAVLVLALGFPRDPVASYAAWALATPVQFVIGWPILRSAAIRARSRQMNMDTLIALGTLAAYGFSAIRIAVDAHAEHYFDTAAVILAAIILGRYFEARAKGIDIAPKYIPAQVFDKRAVEKNQVVFHDVAAIEVKPHVKKNSVAVELTDFSVFYSQDSIASAEAALKDNSSKIVAEKGQIVKVSKDKKGVVSRERLTKKWTDWIDYWAVDFNFESKREIIRKLRDEPKQVQMPGMEKPEQLDLTEYEEVWTGDYIFENEWQSFRTKKDRSLELTSVFHECPPGRRKLAVKVVDIFGNDTMTIVEVSVGEKK